MEDRGILQNIRRPPKLSIPALVASKIIVTGLPIAQVSIGAIYLNECPKQPYIPVYLLVSGVFSLLLGLLSCLPCTQEPEDGVQTPLSRLCTAWNSLVSLFLFCWFIAGNVWIYSIYQPDYTTPSQSDYCNKTLYLFAFWSTTLAYILMGIVILGGCCMFLCMCLFAGSSDVNNV